jgi:hypothetical protein
MPQERKPDQKPEQDQPDRRKDLPEGGARAKPMHDKDREDWEDKRKSKPLRPQH